MKNGYLDCRINKEERLKIDRRIQVDLISHKNIFLSDTKEGKEFGYTIITENSVVSAFCDYIENQLFEDLVYSKEDSIRILEEMIE